MKKSLLAFIFCLSLLLPRLGRAQSFSVQYDTVYATVNGTATNSIYDYIINRTDSALTLSWHVLSTNFPDNWLVSSAFGLCDNNTCYNNGTFGGYSMQLWNDTTNTYGETFTTNTYGDTTTHGPFDLALTLSDAATVGTFWVTVTFSVHGTIGGTQTETFVITRPTPSAVQNIGNQETNVVLYPNPARDEINLVYDASADVKNIAVYNIIGKIMAIYKVTDNSSANLSLENIPSGIYFVRLVNSQGGIVTTKKFTKQ